MCQWHGRGQIVLWRFCVAEVRSRSVASAWPRSGRALGLLLGRGHLVLSGVCLAEVRSSSVASPASPVPCTVSSGSRGPTSSRPGVLLVFVLSGVCFSSVLRCSFIFKLSTAEVASLSVGRLAHLIVAAVSTATDSIDCFSAMACVHRLWSCCFSPDCCVPFLVAPSALYCASTVSSVFRLVPVWRVR